MAIFLLCLPEVWYLLWIFLPTQTGIPMIMAGMEMPAIRAIPTGAPTRVPNCHINFFFLLQGFLPQKVQPEWWCCIETCSILRIVDITRWWQVMKVWYFFHAEPTELWSTDSTGHVVTGSIIHLDDEDAAPGTHLELGSSSRTSTDIILVAREGEWNAAGSDRLSLCSGHVTRLIWMPFSLSTRVNILFF